MSSPLTIYPGRSIMLPLRYCGDIAYYAAMAACGRAVICDDLLYDKRQKAVHRCDIADTHGQVQLTVPVAKPHGVKQARWCDVALSDHGAWWHVHRVTLESAYGRTPFFEFYIDRFAPFLREDVMQTHPTVASLDLDIDREIRSILLIDTETVPRSALAGGLTDDAVKVCDVPSAVPQAPVIEHYPPYYQVRSASQGFIPGLSVLDLIFNLGPEAPLYLQSLIKQLKRG